MSRAVLTAPVLAAALLLAGCTPRPVAPAAAVYGPSLAPAHIGAARRAARPVAAGDAASPGGDASPATVLRDSAAAHAEAFRYAAWPKAKAANVLALVPLTSELNRAIRAMQASRAHGHYGVAETRALRTATDALDDFLQHKRD